MDILGVKVDNLPRKEILEKVNNFLSEDRFHQIATINPEFILEAGRDEDFRNILNNCDLNVADGFGLKFAFWRSGEKLNFRIAGADLMEEILRLAEKNNFKIFLAASSRGLSSWEETRDAIFKKYPKLEIGGKNYGCHSERSASEVEKANFNSVRSLAEFTPLNSGARDDIVTCDIVFANFGAPYQEKFLNSLKTAENSKIKLAMGVGGNFDFLTGKIKRAPVFMRKIGLEWLWRLFQQPRRIKRIFNAVVVFPIKMTFSK